MPWPAVQERVGQAATTAASSAAGASAFVRGRTAFRGRPIQRPHRVDRPAARHDGHAGSAHRRRAGDGKADQAEPAAEAAAPTKATKATVAKAERRHQGDVRRRGAGDQGGEAGPKPKPAKAAPAKRRPRLADQSARRRARTQGDPRPRRRRSTFRHVPAAIVPSPPRGSLAAVPLRWLGGSGQRHLSMDRPGRLRRVSVLLESGPSSTARFERPGRSRPPDKLTKVAWLAILIVRASGLLLSAAPRAVESIIGSASVVVALVYLCDVRPAVREISGGR